LTLDYSEDAPVYQKWSS